MTFTLRRATTAAALIITTMAPAACGGSGDDVTAADATTGGTLPPTTQRGTAHDTTPTTAAADTTLTSTSPVTTEQAPPTTAGPDWRADIAAVCDHFAHAAYPPVPEPHSSPASVVEYFAALRQVRDTAPVPLDTVGLGPGSPIDPARLATLAARGDEHLSAAETAAAAADVDAALAAFEHYYDIIGPQTSAVFLLAGVPCVGSDLDRAAGASLNVPLPNFPFQLEVAFDSVWVSARDGTTVTRVATDNGEILASVEVPLAPAKLQPADGRLWVRTADSYVAIDPTSNTVSATLTKADVGPNADRSWAVDGAMWICDGQRLHRYDPTTLQRSATVELGIDCGQVYATTDLVVAWTYNQDPGESGTSAAAFVDPATNHVMATVPLPVDVGVPILLDDSVFLAGYLGATAVVVDRASWTITATPDLGRPTESSQYAFDGTSIYLPTVDSQSDPVNGRPDVLVVDPTTFTVTDTIETLGANSIDAADGAVWVVDTAFGILQRFDID